MCMIADQEDVARAIFSPKMVFRGKILPAAFELRPHIAEEYLSVMRMSFNSWKEDIWLSGEIVTIVLQASDTFSGHQTGTIRNAAVSDINTVQTNIEGDVTFRIALPGEITGISRISADADNCPVYHINGQRAQNSDKGILVKKGQKYVAK